MPPLLEGAGGGLVGTKQREPTWCLQLNRDLTIQTDQTWSFNELSSTEWGAKVWWVWPNTGYLNQEKHGDMMERTNTRYNLVRYILTTRERERETMAEAYPNYGIICWDYFMGLAPTFATWTQQPIEAETLRNSWRRWPRCSWGMRTEARMRCQRMGWMWTNMYACNM